MFGIGDVVLYDNLIATITGLDGNKSHLALCDGNHTIVEQEELTMVSSALKVLSELEVQICRQGAM